MKKVVKNGENYIARNKRKEQKEENNGAKDAEEKKILKRGENDKQ